ncbi:MAG TPA: LLM class flavin-dependent oxidoreductase [Acidimicrobiia bacterium]|nr:LLM class flavin-dependent oxidoreductase [Acidimicrobiia bacterium]
MRIGVSLRSAYTVADARTGARWMIERAAAARTAGLDSLFVGDYHVIGTPYYQNTPMLGRLLAEWGDTPAGALYSLPLWNPVLLAEHIGTLASIAEGRFILQCGLGDGRRQFAAMGADIHRRASAFERVLATVRTLLAGGHVDGSRVAPVPSEPVEVWIGGSADPAVDRAARLGDGFLAAPYLTLDQARAQLDLYRERCAAHERPVGAAAIRRDVHVGADAADAERRAAPVLSAGYRGFPPDAPVVGGPDEVAASFRELGDIGYTDVIVRHLAEDQAEVLHSFERLAAVGSNLT